MSRILSASRNIKKSELSTIAICCSWAMYRNSEYIFPDHVRENLLGQLRELEEKWKKTLGSTIGTNEIVEVQTEKDDEQIISDGMQLLRDLKYLFSTSVIPLGMSGKLGTTQLANPHPDIGDSSTGNGPSSSASKPRGSGLFFYIPSYLSLYRAPSKLHDSSDSCDECEQQECSEGRDVSRMTPRSAPVNCQLAPIVPSLNMEQNMTCEEKAQKKSGVIGSLKSVLLYPFSSGGNDSSSLHCGSACHEKPPEKCDKCAGILPPPQRLCSCVDTLNLKPPLASCPATCDSCCKPTPLPPLYPINKCPVHDIQRESGCCTPPPETTCTEAEKPSCRKEEERYLPPNEYCSSVKCALDSLPVVKSRCQDRYEDQSENSSSCNFECPISKMLSFSSSKDCPPQTTPAVTSDSQLQNPSPELSNLPHCIAKLSPVAPKRSEECDLKKDACHSSCPKSCLQLPFNSGNQQPCVCQSSQQCKSPPIIPDRFGFEQSKQSLCVCQPTQQTCNNDDDDDDDCERDCTSRFMPKVSAFSRKKKSSDECKPRKEPCECVLLPPKLNALLQTGEKPKCKHSGKPCECVLLPPKLAALNPPTGKVPKCKHSSEPCECILLPPKLSALTSPDETFKCPPPTEPCECILLPPKLAALESRDEQDLCSQESCDPCSQEPYDPCSQEPYDPCSQEPYDPCSQEPYDPCSEESCDPCSQESCDLRDPCDPCEENVSALSILKTKASKLRSLFGSKPEPKKKEELGTLFPPKLSALGGYPQAKESSCGCGAKSPCECAKEESDECEEKPTCETEQQPLCKEKKASCGCENKSSSCGCQKKKPSSGKEKKKLPWERETSKCDHPKTKSPCECAKEESDECEEKPTCETEQQPLCKEKKASCGCENKSSSCGCQKKKPSSGKEGKKLPWERETSKCDYPKTKSPCEQKEKKNPWDCEKKTSCNQQKKKTCGCPMKSACGHEEKKTCETEDELPIWPCEKKACVHEEKPICGCQNEEKTPCDSQKQKKATCGCQKEEKKATCGCQKEEKKATCGCQEKKATCGCQKREKKATCGCQKEEKLPVWPCEKKACGLAEKKPICSSDKEEKATCGCQKEKKISTCGCQKEEKSMCDCQKEEKQSCGCTKECVSCCPQPLDSESKCDWGAKKSGKLAFLNVPIRGECQGLPFKCKPEEQPHSKFGYPPSFSPLDTQPPSCCPPPPSSCPVPKCPQSSESSKFNFWGSQKSECPPKEPTKKCECPQCSVVCCCPQRSCVSNKQSKKQQSENECLDMFAPTGAEECLRKGSKQKCENPIKKKEEKYKIGNNLIFDTCSPAPVNQAGLPSGCGNSQQAQSSQEKKKSSCRDDVPIPVKICAD